LSDSARQDTCVPAVGARCAGRPCWSRVSHRGRPGRRVPARCWCSARCRPAWSGDGELHRLAQAGRDQWHSLGGLSISRTHGPGADQDARVRRACGRCGARPAGGSEHPGACLLGRSQPGQILASGAQARAREHWRVDPLLSASTVRGLPLCCLCTNMWMTCAQLRPTCAYAVEILGIPLPGRTRHKAFTWESATRTLCMQRKRKLSTRHASSHDK